MLDWSTLGTFQWNIPKIKLLHISKMRFDLTSFSNSPDCEIILFSECSVRRPRKVKPINAFLPLVSRRWKSISSTSLKSTIIFLITTIFGFLCWLALSIQYRLQTSFFDLQDSKQVLFLCGILSPPVLMKALIESKLGFKSFNCLSLHRISDETVPAN